MVRKNILKQERKTKKRKKLVAQHPRLLCRKKKYRLAWMFLWAPGRSHRQEEARIALGPLDPPSLLSRWDRIDRERKVASSRSAVGAKSGGRARGARRKRKRRTSFFWEVKKRDHLPKKKGRFFAPPRDSAWFPRFQSIPKEKNPPDCFENPVGVAFRGFPLFPLLVLSL